MDSELCNMKDILNRTVWNYSCYAKEWLNKLRQR